MKTVLLFAGFLLTVCANAQHREHADSSQVAAVTALVLLEQMLTKEDLAANLVRMETVSFPPLYASKKHSHPCPLFVFVLEGELVSEFEGIRKTYKAGECFYEKKNGIHSETRNASSTRSAKILVIYLMKQGQETFVPLP